MADWNPRKIITTMTKEDFKDWCIENRDQLKEYIDALAEDESAYSEFQAWFLTEYDLRTWNALINSSGDSANKTCGTLNYKYLVGKPRITTEDGSTVYNLVNKWSLNNSDYIKVNDISYDESTSTYSVSWTLDEDKLSEKFQTVLSSVEGYAENTYLKAVKEDETLKLKWVELGAIVQENLIQWDDTTKELFKGEEGKYTIVDDILLGDTTVLNRIKAKSTVTASATGTATDEVSYITIDGTEKKISGGITETQVDEKISSAKTELEGEIETAVAVETERALAAENTLQDNIDKKQDTISDLATIRSGAALGTTSVQPATLTDYYDKDETDTQIDTKISQSVGRYITSSTAGANFATKAALTAGPYYYNGETATLIATDYAIVAADEDHDNAQTRYIYSGSQWNYQYTISTTITAAQQAALDSGATSTLIGQITTNKTNITSNTAAIEANATAITNCEKTANKTTSLTTASTDTEYPSAKATFDAIDEVYEDLQSELETATPKYIELSGASGTLTEEQRATLLSGNPTNNYILYSDNILKCIYYNAEDDKVAVYTASLDSGYINSITINTEDYTWTFSSTRLAKYTDLSNKVDKITTTGYGAYGHSDGAEKDWTVSANADEKTLAYRTTDGVLRVGTPTEDDNATTKKYVDDLVGNVETILTTLNTGTGAK